MNDLYIKVNNKNIRFVDYFEKIKLESLSKSKKEPKPKKETYELGKGYLSIETTCMRQKKKTMNKSNSKKENCTFYKFKDTNRYIGKGTCDECGANKCNILKKDDIPSKILANVKD